MKKICIIICIIICIVCTLLLTACSSQTAASDTMPASYTTHVSAASPTVTSLQTPQEKETESGEYFSSQQPNQDFFREVYASDTFVGCFFIHPSEYEFFLSLPQQVECVFRVLMFPEGQYDDPTKSDVDAAGIFADAGCKAEVYCGMGTENNLPYNGTVCFVTATPQRMWELGIALDDGKTGNFFFFEQQYDSVKQRFSTLVWPSEDA